MCLAASWMASISAWAHGILAALALVVAGADLLAGRAEDDRADGHVVVGQGELGLGDRAPHCHLVLISLQI